MPIKIHHIISIIVVMFFATQFAQAQVNAGVTFHQSTNTRLGCYATIKNRVVLEARIIDFSLIEDTPFELLGSYRFLNKKFYEVYAGVGYGFSAIEPFYGVIVLVGANFYPFENKKLGFHIELNPIKEDFSPLAIKASWGIHYTFTWEEEEVEGLKD